MSHRPGVAGARLSPNIGSAQDMIDERVSVVTATKVGLISQASCHLCFRILVFAAYVL